MRSQPNYLCKSRRNDALSSKHINHLYLPCFAVEIRNSLIRKFHLAGSHAIECIIFANFDIFTGKKLSAALTYQNITRLSELSIK